MSNDVNNDGYYQESDDDRDERSIPATDTKPKPFGGECTDPRYASIAHLTGAAFCDARHKIHSEDRSISQAELIDLKLECTPSQVVRTCRNCGVKFIAKKADVKRGWAKFCSKSCKAQM